MSSHGESWFLVLPDCEAGLAVASHVETRLKRTADKQVLHASGRPFLIGSWGPACVTTTRHGLRIAVIGCTSTDEHDVAQRLAEQRDIESATRVARSLRGEFHLVVASGGRLRVRGTASGMRRVFHGDAEGTPVASDRADVVARLLDAPLDEELLAVRLLDSVPHPLGDVPLWRGVHAVPPGFQLETGPNGVSRTRWWRPPEPRLDLEAGAALLRTELDAAVRVRTRAAATVSSDLSGGLDSTAVCALAAAAGATPVALTMSSRDPGDDDLHWAKLAAADLDHAEHVVLPVDRVPLFYSGLLEVTGPVDEPAPTILDQPRQLAGHDEMLARGSALHLTGMGGDHVLWGHPAHVLERLTTDPLGALRHLRGYRAHNRWSLRDALSVVADRRPYGQWLADSADRLTAARAAPHSADVLAWDVPPRMPGWATPDAVAAVRDRMRQAAQSAVPLGRTRARHNELNVLRHGTRVTRVLHQVAEHGGLPMASPFFDDRVIEACWSVRAEERSSPWQYKPLLKAALRGVVPAAVLERETKGEASTDAANGLRENRARIAELWHDSRLARLGLVDADRLVRTTLQPSSPELRYAGLDSTLACEIWLRTT
ncbi:asparagine synthase (glutamine-hydrolysing) [Streptomyces sp. DI166]|nr:asparagine synthase (glutamine-hydrolysing) [Streptomyces sp. DI166]